MAENGAAIGGGFTEGELKFASFWVRNRPAIRKAVYVAFIVVNVGLWGYVLWGILDAYAISYPRESRITADIAQDQVTMDALQADRPVNVRAANALVLATTDGRYDMAVDVENPNAQWWAEFTYRFNFSGEQTSLRNGFIMPGSKTVLTELGFRPKGRGGATAQLVVDGIRWHRVDPSVVGASYKEYELERSNVAFENVTYQGGLVVGTKEVGRTSFDLKNRGSYGYWSYDVVVRLYRGSTVVGVNRISLMKISPGDERHFDLDWFEKLPSVTRTEIIPIVNYLDEATYLPTERF
ncbi:MAG: hypothetical protein V1745_04935 [Patescibacteria group bacterium]